MGKSQKVLLAVLIFIHGAAQFATAQSCALDRVNLDFGQQQLDGGIGPDDCSRGRVYEFRLEPPPSYQCPRAWPTVHAEIVWHTGNGVIRVENPAGQVVVEDESNVSVSTPETGWWKLWIRADTETAVFTLTMDPLHGDEFVCSSWLPIAARSPGVGGTLWTTELAVTNLAMRDDVIEVVLLDNGQRKSIELLLPANGQLVADDIVGRITENYFAGPLEIMATVPIVASVNIQNTGTGIPLSQRFSGLTVFDGLGEGTGGLLEPLFENSGRRSNIGVCNLGWSTATVEIVLYDGAGIRVGSYSLSAEPGAAVQDNRPFSNRFDRRDIDAGYATVSITTGKRVFVYASVVDNRSHNPTTVPMVVGAGHGF